MASHFQLQPFTPGEAPQGLKVSGSVERGSGTLFITYIVAGDPGRVVLPAPAPAACRRHELWRRTCFEIFLGRPGQTAYWETNFSPTGDWNVYRFADYRQGMAEEECLGEIWCRVKGDPQRREFSCRLDIHELFADSEVLTAGIACVVLDTGGRTSYWALGHCGSKPDFHDRRSFLLPLPAPCSRNAA